MPFSKFVLQPASKSTKYSEVWSYFKRLFERNENNTIAPVKKAHNRVVCVECFKKKKFITRYDIIFISSWRKKKNNLAFQHFNFFSYASTTSGTVLKKHLAAEHNITIAGSNDCKIKRNVTEIIINQKTLNEISGRSDTNHKDKRFFVAKEAVLMICAALLPFSLVESDAFARFFSRTSSTYSRIKLTFVILN